MHQERIMRGRMICFIAASGLTLLPFAAIGSELSGLPFFFSKPAGDGPFPAVVILHDCSGLAGRSTGAPWRWASELTQRGFVTVWPDSFSSRGHVHGLCADARPPGVPAETRAHDARDALAYLRSLPFVDTARIAVMGGSHGGSSTLATVLQGEETGGAGGFAAAVALYPNCNRSLGDWQVTRRMEGGKPVFSYSGVFKPAAPLLILVGEMDDWTPAEACRRLAATAASAGLPVRIKVYPGAHHSFDSTQPVRYIAERINTNSTNGRGATTGGNAQAWSDAIHEVDQFLQATLGIIPSETNRAPSQPHSDDGR
jgi:dienelactone hydrolase